MRPVAHHADDQHAENRAQNRSLAARKRRAADDGRGNDVGFEAKAGPARLSAWQKREARNSRERRESARRATGRGTGRPSLDYDRFVNCRRKQRAAALRPPRAHARDRSHKQLVKRSLNRRNWFGTSIAYMAGGPGFEPRLTESEFVRAS